MVARSSTSTDTAQAVRARMLEFAERPRSITAMQRCGPHVQATTKRDFRSIDADVFGLDVDTTYLVLSATSDDLRVINRFGEPLLYAVELFQEIGGDVPAGWRFRVVRDEDGKPGHWLEHFSDVPGFYEWIHDSDGDQRRQDACRQALDRILVETLHSVGPSERALVASSLAAYRQWISTSNRSTVDRSQN